MRLVFLPLLVLFSSLSLTAQQLPEWYRVYTFDESVIEMNTFLVTFISNDYQAWYSVCRRSNITLRFSCGARSAFKLKEQGYLSSTLSRRQLQALVRWRAEKDALLYFIFKLFGFVRIPMTIIPAR